MPSALTAMPFYEFYCPNCHVIFNYFARRVNTTSRPDCPRCERPELERKASVFAISRGGRDSEVDDGMDGLPANLDEAALEKAMGAMAGDLDKLDENDPKAMGQMMRKLFDATGLKPNSEMQEALRRIESGEDPDQVEADMGDVLDSDDLFALGQARQIGRQDRRQRRPEIDPTVRDLF